MSDLAGAASEPLGHLPAHEAAHHEHRDDTGARIGMWLFLFTELMLFGVMFIIYAVLRATYSRQFHEAALELNVAMGSFNTFVLLTSSLTMVLSIAALQRRDKQHSLCFLLCTICLGVLFLFNKFFEWTEKFHHGIYPNSEHLQQLPQGEAVFYGLYFVMTGIHGLHVVAGVVLLSVMFVLVAIDKINPDRYVALDNSGLYWHLVDVIWIFLLPLFYVTT